MVVRHWMTPVVVTITKDASIQKALAVMRQHSIRHLPVVDERHHLQDGSAIPTCAAHWSLPCWRN